MDGASGTSIHNVEEGIESWVTQSMPLASDMSSDSQGTPLQSLLLDSPVKYPTALCYGMVSCILILLSAMSVSIVCVWSLI
jgi:hypothetical protein